MRTMTLATILLVAILCTPALTAEPPRQLLHADSLLGWDYGPNTNGWKIASGKLSGKADSAPLLSGWTLGDFELALNWSVSEHGAITLIFPVAPPHKDRIADQYITPEWRLVLREGDSCGQLFDGTRMIAIGETPIARRDQHTASLKRSGDRIALVVDGTQLWDVQATDARFGLQLSVSEGSGQVSDVTLVEPSGDPLFNEKDFAGWETDDPPEAWIVEDGQIVCTGKGRDYLRTKESYGNFTLSLDYNLSRRGNSGIGIRTPRGGWPSGDGMELQLYDERPETPLNRHSTMAIYGNLEPLGRAEKPAEWNHAVIKAEGNIITAWVNGALVQHANTMRLPELKHRHLEGWIGLQNHHSPIRYRNITLLRGGEGTGFPAWYAPRKPNASQQVLDRLMNTERLARADGIQSGSITKSIDKSGSSVLAELVGPAALVEFAAIGNSSAIGGSSVSFYFDGEAEPRIKCPIRDLERRVPPISEGGMPILTYLAFERSLKIELAASGPAEYRLDFVKLPVDVPIETFRDREQSVSRGMLPAVSYRHDQMEGGRVRERDPYPHQSSGPKSLEPGKTVELVNVSGAGVIDWWTLAPLNLLANDDLWLEVTVNGEAEPAIKAPARFLFPGLSDERDWHNFVVTHSEGATNRLAMPFRDGIKIIARNQGKSPAEVNCAVSVHPAAAEAQAPLRAAFAQDGPIGLDSAGRLVGLVCSAPAPGKGTVQITADGDKRSSKSLDLFLGIRAGDDMRGFLAGRAHQLAWRHLLLSPVDFAKSLEVKVDESDKPLPTLVLYYGN